MSGLRDDDLARRVHPDTLAAHAVRVEPPESLPEGLRSRPAAPPIDLSSAYDFESLEASLRPLQGGEGYAYARYGHPAGRALERTLAALEGAEDAVATASGMAAICGVVLAAAGQGDTVVLQEDAYGGTSALFRRDFERLGIEVLSVDVRDPGRVAEALERRPKVMLVESLSNPLVRTVDIPALAVACRAAGARLVVDGTFATPALHRPLDEGAEVVVHSATKFIGGHHDLTAGVVCGAAPFITEVRRVSVRTGGRVAPFDAWLALRGVRTLGLRMQRAQSNAAEFAARLRADDRVGAVHHPGWGAMLSFDCGSRETASAVARAVQICSFTPSLGGVTTTLSHPATSSHCALLPEERARLGIGEGLLRVSCGIEAVEDVWSDLSTALGGG
jgi:cystathionine beta-lyase/cystathionine gamma-synthase